MDWRIILAPFSGIWWLITSSRNVLYYLRVLPSKKFKLPIICIGNLSTGGTGKSPHTIYVANFLKNKFRTAILSRGYGRNTKGFIIANYDSNAGQIGDEPMQFFTRFKNGLVVTVGENRVEAVKKLLARFQLDVIVLDDAFQHRRLKPGFSILLTDYSHLFTQDYLLPRGNLRESGAGAKRANAIVVTKCPDDLSDEEKADIQSELEKYKKPIYFSRIIYGDYLVHVKNTLSIQEARVCNVLLITGIANPDLFVAHVKNNFERVKHFAFPDHHQFKPKEIEKLVEEFESMPEPRIILTTEKDYMRLKQEYALLSYLYFLPIEVKINEKEKFNQQILDYVHKN